MKSKERTKEFLKEYYKICKKYRLVVEACGCCSSPWLVEEEDEEEILDHIRHLAYEEGYTKEEVNKLIEELRRDDNT